MYKNNIYTYVIYIYIHERAMLREILRDMCAYNFRFVLANHDI